MNDEPFAYVSMPGVLRAPIIAAFGDFDDQLRGIQLLNIPLVAIVALLSAYIFSWTLPQSRHWMAIVFSFAFTLLSPIWIANIFLPLADAPYAAFTLGALLIAIELLCSNKRAASRPWLSAMFLVLFVVSFQLRFTAPVLLLFAASLAVARWQERGVSRRFKLAVFLGTASVVAGLVAFNFQPIFHRYLREPMVFLERSEKSGMIVNLLGAAMPSQVIPSFYLGFMHPPILDTYRTAFSTTMPDMAWAAFGILISAVIIVGMWQSRRRFLPELAYLAGALPIIALVLPSTMRYMMSYQPLFWIFAYAGLTSVVNRYVPGLKRDFRSRIAITTLAILALGLAAGLRSWKVAGTASERYFAVTATRIPNYVSDVSSTFRSLRTFIETLPQDRTLLIGPKGTMGRWHVISGRSYYYPDNALSRIAKAKDVYLVLECGTLEACQAWEVWKDRAEARVLRVGDFAFDSVFGASSGRARAEVLRVRPLN